MKYSVSLSVWINVEAETEEDAFAVGHRAVDTIRELVAYSDGEVHSVTEREEL
mgnify:CR=1 FL=1|tara:strand:- start:830 stop:988 length:159 start_codon:yes stop_codon:yes gene_type:complete